MSVWQDQTPRQPGTGAALGPAAADPGRPLSRREARERERQAAEALATGQEHPSGVVDFDGYDFDPDFHPERGFGEQDTADIWAALSRRSQQPPQPTGPQPTGPQPEAEAPRAALPPVTDDLMDRVRGAVLRRDREELDPTAIAPVIRPSALAPGTPAAPGGLPSRRAIRREEAGRTTEDGLPSAWFSDAPAAFTGAPVEDVPPTVAMPAVDRAEREALAPVTAQVNLPRAFVQPAGDDAVAFSSIAPFSAPTALPGALADPAFVEPVVPEAPQAWSVRHQAWSVEPAEAPAADQPWTDPQALVTATPAWSDAPVAPPTPAAPTPAGTWVDQQPYSEPTDLAGFEALIKRARGAQPQPQPLPVAPPQDLAARPWAEPEALQTGRTSFERAVIAQHGASNALVLPEDPTPDLTQAVSRTGDIFITGSMKLPRSLSTTGATEEHYDGLDVDRLYEAAHAEPAAGVAPVRATRAVGQASAGRTVVGRRGRGNVLPTVLAVVAGAMAVGVLVLLVGSWVLKLF